MSGENIDVKALLRASEFRFNKNLGQNFITDKNLLSAIVCDAGVNEGDIVVEIGTGAGTLTREIAKKAKKVISFEVDERLLGVLNETLKGLSNVDVVFKDVLKLSDEKLKEHIGPGPFKVVANLPYYVTTPMIMRFLESGLDAVSLTVMVQKEVADRLCAAPGTKDYAQITLMVKLMGEASITRKVPREVFFPSPNVDSAVVRIDIDRSRYDEKQKKMAAKVIKRAFAMRRKTLLNNLTAGLSLTRDEAKECILSCGFSENVRGEELSLEDYFKLSEKIFNLVKRN
ncbi:MAG: 16S rRNA (adenine(1518)-N(6)/adenine(1519)-N(6))-dimethyltransferase RsmA [Clostridiales bacterium]|nr:16S rRNA (adenine(1518)-N(6)/adenine(1519)-N(6))-dimethyltransferase RsmA [Clostridiales bacterium]